jgi:hypothetical protein
MEHTARSYFHKYRVEAAALSKASVINPKCAHVMCAGLRPPARSRASCVCVMTSMNLSGRVDGNARKGQQK